MKYMFLYKSNIEQLNVIVEKYLCFRLKHVLKNLDIKIKEF